MSEEETRTVTSNSLINFVVKIVWNARGSRRTCSFPYHKDEIRVRKGQICSLRAAAKLRQNRIMPQSCAFHPVRESIKHRPYQRQDAVSCVQAEKAQPHVLITPRKSEPTDTLSSGNILAPRVFVDKCIPAGIETGSPGAAAL